MRISAPLKVPDHLPNDTAIAAQELTSGPITVALGVGGIASKIAEQKSSGLGGHVTGFLSGVARVTSAPRPNNGRAGSRVGWTAPEPAERRSSRHP